jgi:hypothetical protein
MRLKQFIIDEYEFNLDLETWGLTSKQKELKRFENLISAEDIAKSNALFGYHGDKYYFDVDIRRHFGLDKYDNDVIPYWKTETVEAMDAFRYKPWYTKKAGECVSLAALYAAAAFVVCGIPLEDIYMILTPLHSQNYIDVRDGILTNNRRLVTKTMWFNGTAISNKAQRALRNERVTIVAHSTGYVHCLYKDATMDKDCYEGFAGKLASYLSTELDMTVFASFLRSHRDYQKYFQVCRECRGQAQFLEAEVLFHYEHGSDYKIADTTHEKLLAEVSDEDFVPYELPGRIRCDKLDEFIQQRKIDVRKPQGKAAFEKFIEPVIPDAQRFANELADFVHIEAKLPAMDKSFVQRPPIEISSSQSRGEIIDHLQKLRPRNATVDLAFYAYRDMQSADWVPFIKAAIERNPVSIEKTRGMSIDQIRTWLSDMADESIYEGKRLAQPDEVANYGRGDGLEKAILLANVIHERKPAQDVQIVVDDSDVIVKGQAEHRFGSSKGLEKEVVISGSGDMEARS